MRRAAIILIVIAIVVVIGANVFVGNQPDPEFIAVRDDATLRKTSSGDVVGFRDRYGARAWLGIPFAQPPSGINRWRAPLPPLPDQDTLEALAIANMCPQFASPLSSAGEVTPGAVAGEEDCLYLNVWSPPNAANLPVMFWIHGGGNSIGHGGSYSGAALAARRDVVVVSINYRLGLFGWFSHPALATGDPADDSGNYGTLDAIRALQWVQQNIGEFGGDPANVTVFGESAGAFDTLAMMASPLAAGLFHKAVVQSGGYRSQEMRQAQNYASEGGHVNSSQELVARMLVADGMVPDAEAARQYQADMSHPRLREYLYAKPAPEFFTQLDGGGFGMVNLPLIFRDGYVLPDMLDRELFSSSDNHNMVPVILGTNRDEPALFMVRNPAFVENWLGFLPRLKDPETYQRIVKYGALAWKERGVDSLAQFMRQAGNKDVYAYRFDWDEEPSQAGFDLSVALGAGHGLEIAFVFDEFQGGLGLAYLYPDDEAQYALATSMSSYWAEFAHSGSPGMGRDGKQTPWLAWGQEGKTSIILDSPADQGIHMADHIVSVESIKKELLADTGFTNPEDKCAIYVRNFRDSRFDQAEYEALDVSCANLDPAGFSAF